MNQPGHIPQHVARLSRRTSGGGLVCPSCGDDNGGRCLDSRTHADGRAIRRRRICTVTGCGYRWTTFEIELPDDFNIDQVVGAAERLSSANATLSRVIAGLQAFQKEVFPDA